MKFFNVFYFVMISFFFNQEIVLASESEENKKHLEFSIISIVPAPYGDYDFLKTDDWNVQGGVFCVGADLAIDDLNAIHPFFMHNKLFILQELGEPFKEKKPQLIEKKMEISSRKILCSQSESGIYFGSHDQAFLSKVNQITPADSIVALRSKGDIFISVDR